MLYRRYVHRRQKRGGKVGKTKRGKGTKLMAVADSAGLPVAVYTQSASPHEVTLVRKTLVERFTDEKPERLISNKAYDSDPLDAELEVLDIEIILNRKLFDQQVKFAIMDIDRCSHQRCYKIERVEHKAELATNDPGMTRHTLLVNLLRNAYLACRMQRFYAEAVSDPQKRFVQS